jgi:hypothetical protein
VQIGLRTTNDDSQGFAILDARQVHRQGTEAIIAAIRQRVGDMPVYLTFDIDCLDPAYAPGTGTPVCGGLSTVQALEILGGLRGINLVGMDLVEVAPAYDHADITALAGATLAMEMLCLYAARHKVEFTQNRGQSGGAAKRPLSLRDERHTETSGIISIRIHTFAANPARLRLSNPGARLFVQEVKHESHTAHPGHWPGCACRCTPPPQRRAARRRHSNNPYNSPIQRANPNSRQGSVPATPRCAARPPTQPAPADLDNRGIGNGDNLRRQQQTPNLEPTRPPRDSLRVP